MIPRSVLAHIIERQRRDLDEMQSGLQRHILSRIPYLTQKALVLGGVRGCGISTLMAQMIRQEYPKALYVDFEDPRLAGFDADDFVKLSSLIEDSGKGVLFLDKIDRTNGWVNFIINMLARGIKIVMSVSLAILKTIEEIQCNQSSGLKELLPESKRTHASQLVRVVRNNPQVSDDQREYSFQSLSILNHYERSKAREREDDETNLIRCCDLFLPFRIPLFSYTEFLEINHRKGSESAVVDYMIRGTFPDQQKQVRQPRLRTLYQRLLNEDVLLPKKIRDHKTLERVALMLISENTGPVTANHIRTDLKIKAVSTVTEHMDHLEKAGLINLVPIWTQNRARQNVNPRKVYTVDTALATALTYRESEDKSRVFEALIYNYLQTRYAHIYYTVPDGGCDFVVEDEGSVRHCIQACFDPEDTDAFRTKVDGLLAALSATGIRKGTIVTLAHNDRISYDDVEVEVIDADTFLSE